MDGTGQVRAVNRSKIVLLKLGDGGTRLSLMRNRLAFTIFSKVILLQSCRPTDKEIVKKGT